MRGNKYNDVDAEIDEKPGFCSKLKGIVKFVWNSRTKEFCGRDGSSWGLYF